MKKLLSVLLISLLVTSLLAGCSGTSNTTNNSSAGSKNDSGQPTDNFTPTGGTLRVYNAAEYMDMTTVREFEREYNIKVEYTVFDSNEELYTSVKNNPSAYDVVVPSDYMIDRLKQEGLLSPLDKDKIPNISHVAEQYLAPSYDPNNDYVVPYMVGTVGILYNTRVVTSPVTSWAALWNNNYQRPVFMWDSMRDSLGVALSYSGYSMNSSSSSEINAATQALMTQKTFVRYGNEDILSYMIADEGALAVVYSGEAKRAIDLNPRLAYVIPAEGSNKWVDGFVIMSGVQNKQAAEDFINFMCRPNIAIRNMTSTGYTSPISGAWDEFANNSIMFPSDTDLARCEAFIYNSEAMALYEQAWKSIR